MSLNHDLRLLLRLLAKIKCKSSLRADENGAITGEKVRDVTCSLVTSQPKRGSFLPKALTQTPPSPGWPLMLLLFGFSFFAVCRLKKYLLAFPTWRFFLSQRLWKCRCWLCLYSHTLRFSDEARTHQMSLRCTSAVIEAGVTFWALSLGNCNPGCVYICTWMYICTYTYMPVYSKYKYVKL